MPVPRAAFRWQVCFVGFLLIYNSCEIDTTIKVSRDNPPKFTFGGSGVLDHLIIYEVDPRNDALPPKDRDPLSSKPIWRINAQFQPVDLGRITAFEYGHAPSGFVQVIPESGTAPPPLVEGKSYRATAYVNGAAGGTVRFLIKNGQTVVSDPP
jgi:hypothetical protein